MQCRIKIISQKDDGFFPFDKFKLIIIFCSFQTFQAFTFFLFFFIINKMVLFSSANIYAAWYLIVNKNNLYFAFCTKEVLSYQHFVSVVFVFLLLG